VNALIIFNSGKRGDAKRLSKRIHYDFLLQFNKIFDNVYFYGRCENGLPHTPFLFSYGRKIRFLEKELSLDVIFVFSYFCGKGSLPVGFSSSKTLKICIEVDYWNVRDKEWYKYNNFDFIMQRGYYRKSVIDSVWVPFSCADVFLQYQTKNIKSRIRKIGFAGRGHKYQTHGLYYPIRKEVLKKLDKENLISIFGVVGHKNYPIKIGKHFCMLSDTGRVKSPPAKTFEIMGAGALLFTSPFHGAEDLFGKEKFCHYYMPANPVRFAKEVYAMSDNQIEDIIGTAKEVIKEKHLDNHRLQEIYDIVHEYEKTKRIIRKWQV